MKGNKAALLTVAEKCKNILAANWQGQLSTIKADAKGSKGEIYTSKVKYLVKRGKPYLWVPENDAHNLNTIIDERGSLAVTTPFPGPLGSLLKFVKKLPSRIALTGDVVLLKEKKAQVATEKLEALILSEQRAVSELSYTVHGIFSSTNPVFTSRLENLQALTNDGENYNIFKFDLRSCTYVGGNGGTLEVDMEELQSCKADSLAPYSAMLIDGINQSESRRRALVLFCFTQLNACVRDAYVTSLDRHGLDVLGKVPGPASDGQFQWREFRLAFKEEAADVETFCRQLVDMEEEAIKKVSSYGGLS